MKLQAPSLPSRLTAVGSQGSHQERSPVRGSRVPRCYDALEMSSTLASLFSGTHLRQTQLILLVFHRIHLCIYT